MKHDKKPGIGLCDAKRSGSAQAIDFDEHIGPLQIRQALDEVVDAAPWMRSHDL